MAVKPIHLYLPIAHYSRLNTYESESIIINQGREDTMPSKVLELDDGFFLLKIQNNKRVTLPDGMMEHMGLKDTDLITVKLAKDGTAHLKRFDSEVIKF